MDQAVTQGHCALFLVNFETLYLTDKTSFHPDINTGGDPADDQRPIQEGDRINYSLSLPAIYSYILLGITLVLLSPYQ